MAEKKHRELGVAHELAHYMAQSLSVKKRTKRVAARLAISSAIRDGIFQAGDTLPPEIELAAHLGVGLGTVQVALKQLQDIGTITRRRGDGTKVASTEPLEPTVWHFRFIRIRDGVPLHPIADWVKVGLVPNDQTLEAKLGKSIGYQRVLRRYSANGGEPFGAEMFLNPAFGIDLTAMPIDELKMVNIRTYLQDQFNIEAEGSNQTVRLREIDDDTARRFDLLPGQLIQEVQALTSARDGQPIYFQRIFVPAKHYALNFINTAN
jgi:DNA-binding GntR family transcriptional regulator